MHIISTNIAEPTVINWNGNDVTTGIYKTPTNEPIFLGKENVKGDEVSDRKVHGGEYKACYLFSSDHYSYWKDLYPNLDWDFGMFGENLTVHGLDETKIQIGDIYRIGSALIQVTQPREPCFKLGYKFGKQDILKQFIEHERPGIYVRILEKGFVEKNDSIVLMKSATNSLTIVQFFNLLFSKTKNLEHLKLAINNASLPISKRVKLRAFLNK